MKTETKAASREARRAALKAEYDAKRIEVARTARRGAAVDFAAAIHKTIYRYAWGYSWNERDLTKEVEADVQCGCGGLTIKLPAGTPGWYAFEDSVTYDRYIRIGDEDYPAAGAKIISRKRHHIWACLVEVDGRTVAAIATKHE